MGLHPGLRQAPERGGRGRFPARAGAAAGAGPPTARALCWQRHLCFSVPQEVASVVRAGVGSRGRASQHKSSPPSRAASGSVLGVVPFIKILRF